MTTDTTRRAMLGATCAALAGGAAINLAAITIAKAETGSAAEPVSANDNLSFAEDFSPRMSCAEMVVPERLIPDDPIFALIERHKALYDAVEASAYGSGFIEQDRLDADVEKVNEVRDAILAAPFTTPAGMAAMIRFLIEFELEAYDYTEHGGAFLRRLADALDRRAVLS